MTAKAEACRATLWDYMVVDWSGTPVSIVLKELFHMTDIYIIDVVRDEDTFGVLMVVLAIDAEKYL